MAIFLLTAMRIWILDNWRRHYTWENAQCNVCCFRHRNCWSDFPHCYSHIWTLFGGLWRYPPISARHWWSVRRIIFSRGWYSNTSSKCRFRCPQWAFWCLIASLDGLALTTIFIQSQPLWLIFVGYLKDSVYKNSLHTVDELKEEMSPLDIRITSGTLNTVITKFQDQLQLVLNASGSHIENFFHWLFSRLLFWLTLKSFLYMKYAVPTKVSFNWFCTVYHPYQFWSVFIQWFVWSRQQIVQQTWPPVLFQFRCL